MAHNLTGHDHLTIFNVLWRGDNAQPMLVRRHFRSANGVRIRIIVTDADGDDIVDKTYSAN